MPYASLPDLIARFGEDEIVQLTDTDGSHEPDAVVVARALADADAEIDAALAGRYTLPLAQVPELLRRIACDLVRELLYTDTLPEVVKQRAQTARGLLRGVASGVTRFDGLAAAVTASPAASDARVAHGRPRMRWDC